jgi:2-keto-4-pentenoate hydratase/2-oxohepta-3-ene-1,7-dioic acid hydratase in catechol pathway
MRLAIFDDQRLGVVTPDATGIVDVGAALPWPHDAEPLGAGWWVRLCRDFAQLRPAIEAAVARGPLLPLASVRLRAPVLNPTKVVACASNSAAHVDEMRAVTERAAMDTPAWMHAFDVFLKAPSSIVGPRDEIVLTAAHAGREVHHEAELAIVVGTGGSRIAAADALDHVLGYAAALDMTLRAQGDRSRRKSYDTFTPIGPWITTGDEIGDPSELRVRLDVNGTCRQDYAVAELDRQVPAIVEYASNAMRLEPGDVILAGAAPGVGEVRGGDAVEIDISRVGSMRLGVRQATEQ